jgi:multisubunit Na+/H+ antiporter MnhB subunit
MVVVAGYLLWAGATLPGGAFQSAAVLAGAGLLLVLSGLAEPPAFGARWWRALACLGFVLFLLAAAVLLPTQGALLRYPREAAGALILAIETGLAVSIALMLIAFFAHRRGGR